MAKFLSAAQLGSVQWRCEAYKELLGKKWILKKDFLGGGQIFSKDFLGGVKLQSLFWKISESLIQTYI